MIVIFLDSSHSPLVLYFLVLLTHDFWSHHWLMTSKVKSSCTRPPSPFLNSWASKGVLHAGFYGKWFLVTHGDDTNCANVHLLLRKTCLQEWCAFNVAILLPATTSLKWFLIIMLFLFPIGLTSSLKMCNQSRVSDKPLLQIFFWDRQLTFSL